MQRHGVNPTFPHERITLCTVWPGSPYPLGATWDGAGRELRALRGERRVKVELCLFDSADAGKETQRIPPTEQTDRVWHGYLLDVLPGQLYGYRVHGPYEPAAGHRFNPQEGHARPLREGDRARHPPGLPRCSATSSATPAADLSRDDRDNAALAPLAAVVDTVVHLGRRRASAPPWHQTLIYKLHVKGFTKRMGPAFPGKFQGP